MIPSILAFDVESNGLHGEGFAVGAVLLNAHGVVTSRFQARCPIHGAVEPWVAANVLPALAGMEWTHDEARWMRDSFWAWLSLRPAESLVVVDCGWPVEARFLADCVADDATRQMKGPYPLHEVATLLYAAGFDPLGHYSGIVLPEGPPAEFPGQAHHPLYDALVSGLCARMALQSLDGRVEQP